MELIQCVVPYPLKKAIAEYLGEDGSREEGDDGQQDCHASCDNDDIYF